MAHYGNSVELKRKTPKEWLVVTSQVGELVNKWAGRDDLVAHVSADAGQTGMGVATASFNPSTAEVEVNTVTAFGAGVKPKHVGDLRQRMEQYEQPKAVGAIFHEASHAKFTTWDLKAAAHDLKPSENRAMHLLEETRMEGLAAATVPGNRLFLRASALEIAIGDMKDVEELSGIRQSAQLAGLALARVDAGVLEPDDVLAIREQVEKSLPVGLLPKLEAIWKKFQGITTVNAKSTQEMYKLAKEWDKLVQDAAEEAGEGKEGDGVGISQEMADAIAEALGEDAAATEVGAGMDMGDQQRTEEWSEKAAAKGAKGKEREQNRDVSTKVFGQGSGPLKAKTNSRLIEKRAAKPEERRAAIIVGEELERAKYQDRVRIEAANVMPPGRLRSRSIVQGAAYKAQGLHQTIEPFRHVTHKHADDPNLTIGMMVDISGSMSIAMQPMSAAAWVMSEACRRIQATSAMVYYGNDVFPTLMPGQHLDEVHVYDAPDGTESFDRGFRALDGALDLLNGSGARLLVIASDGCYGGYGVGMSESDAVKKWLNRCMDEGVAVLWLGFGHASYAQEHCKGTDAVFLPMKGSLSEAALAIGDAGARALTLAGDRRNRG